MSKHYLILITFSVLFFNTLISYSQYKPGLIYYDAKKLISGAIQEKKEILSFYDVNNDNIYLKDYVQRFNTDGFELANSTGSIISNVSGLNITKYVDGYAKFLVTRVKQELTKAYFQKFSKTIRDKKYKDVQSIFNKTYGELDEIGDKIYNYKPYLNDLRTALLSDINQVPYSINALLKDNNSQISLILNKKPNAHYVAKHCFEIGLQIHNNKHIGRVISDIDFSASFKTDPTLVFSLKSLQLFSTAFRHQNESESDKYWLSQDKFQEIFNNDELAKVFVGLIAAKAKKDGISNNTTSLYSILNSLPDLKSIKLLFQNINEVAIGIENAVSNDRTKNDPNLAMEYINLTAQFLGIVKSISTTFNVNNADVNKIDTFIQVIDYVKQFNNSLINKNYSTSVSSVTKLLAYLGLKNDENLNPLVKYGDFIGEMIEAEDSDELSEVIESFAAPVGSWRDKKKNQWTIALDNYVGPTLFERGRFSFSTPVGISASLGVSEDVSLTLMGSIFDIGPLVSYRFLNDSSDVAKIYLKEIIAPGVFLSLGFYKDNPIFLNIGYQRASKLRRVGSEENQVDITSNWWFGGSITVNIPLMTIYKK